MQVSLKGETGFVSYFNLEYRIVEKNFRYHLITMRHFYGVNFLNKSVCNISPLVSARRRNDSYNCLGQTCKKYVGDFYFIKKIIDKSQSRTVNSMTLLSSKPFLFSSYNSQISSKCFTIKIKKNLQQRR